MRKGCTLIVKKSDLNPVNDGASAKASPFHALIVLGKNDCPYWLVVWPICLNFMLCFLLVPLYASTRRYIPQDPNIIWDANISLSVFYLSPFIGTFILWDIDNLLLRLISEEHRQSMVDSTRKLYTH